MNREQFTRAAASTTSIADIDKGLSEFLKKHFDKVLHFAGSAVLTIIFTLIGGIWVDPVVFLVFGAAAAFFVGFLYEKWQQSRGIPDDGDIPVNMFGCFFGMVVFLLIHAVTVSDLMRRGLLDQYLF